ncbi:hypothetical protein GC173_11505 [bacterium]|nr:hypothetical protein [bacterium]
MFRSLTRSFILLAALAVTTVATAEVDRVLARINLPAGETTSIPTDVAADGMIRAALVKSEVPFTLTASALIGASDTIDLYTETESTTGTLTLANFANKPIAETTRLTITVEDAPEEDVGITVLFLIER